MGKFDRSNFPTMKKLTSNKALCALTKRTPTRILGLTQTSASKIQTRGPSSLLVSILAMSVAKRSSTLSGQRFPKEDAEEARRINQRMKILCKLAEP